ncbi:MAG TPA: cytochrome b N-terminal domain-containing protein, partial [Acidimicrobiales bacterium]|nr:cytochrome b N-terminal domain-containing protein [Acidimicrobiales bacterium]
MSQARSRRGARRRQSTRQDPVVAGVRWLDERLGVAKGGRVLLDKIFPDHWSFLLGEIALYSFVVLVATGIFLSLYFVPSANELVYHGIYAPLRGSKVSAAYASTVNLSFGVRSGLVIRQMHHWAALIFVAAVVAHVARIFFTAAYRRPRELTWMVGVTLLILALANGFFGYSIGGDLLSGAGLRIGYAISLSVPVIGRWIAFLLLGGDIPNPVTVPRLYSLHIFLIPAAIAMLLALHLGLVWRQMHTNFPGPGRTNRTIVGSRLWPAYAAKSLGLFCLLFALIAMVGGLVQIDPVWIYGPYDPTAIMPGAQPDWYLGWVEGAIRLFPALKLRTNFLVPGLFFSAVLFPSLLFCGLYLYPFLDKLISG